MYVPMYVRIYIYVCMHVRIYVCMYYVCVCMFACVYVCMYVRTNVCMYLTNCTSSRPKSRTFSATARLSQSLSNMQIDQLIQYV